MERENFKKNKDPVLITIVTEILRLNNYVIWFFKGSGKVRLVTSLETTLFTSFQAVTNLSFRNINRLDEPKRIYLRFRDSKKKLTLSLVVYLLQLQQLLYNHK